MEENEENILATPSIKQTIGAYRLSQSSDATFATATTRASSVMPHSKPNLGLTEQQQENITENELKFHFDETKVGKKNKDLGFSVMPQSAAKVLNAENKNLATFAFREQEQAERSKEENKKKRKRYFKVGLIVLFLFVLVAVVGAVSVVIISSESTDSVANEEDINVPNSLPTVTPQPVTTSDPPTTVELNVDFTDFGGVDVFELLCANADDNFLNSLSMCDTISNMIFECTVGVSLSFVPVGNCDGCTGACQNDVLVDVDADAFCDASFCESEISLRFEDSDDAESAKFLNLLVENCRSSSIFPGGCVFDEILTCSESTLQKLPDPDVCVGFDESCSDVCDGDFCEIECIIEI